MHRLYTNTTSFYTRDLSILGCWYFGEVLEEIQVTEVYAGWPHDGNYERALWSENSGKFGSHFKTQLPKETWQSGSKAAQNLNAERERKKANFMIEAECKWFIWRKYLQMHIVNKWLICTSTFCSHGYSTHCNQSLFNLLHSAQR